jgi:hypothetical protein
MLVHAYASMPGKAKWSGPQHTIKMLHFVLFHTITCYTNSIVSHMHSNTRKLHKIMCTLVAIGVILQSLECMFNRPCGNPRVCPFGEHVMGMWFTPFEVLTLKGGNIFQGPSCSHNVHFKIPNTNRLTLIWDGG